MIFVGNKYGNQFTNTGGGGGVMHYMHKIDVGVNFTLIIAKKGIKSHIELSIAYI